jgi:hypothetical protein
MEVSPRQPLFSRGFVGVKTKVSKFCGLMLDDDDAARDALSPSDCGIHGQQTPESNEFPTFKDIMPSPTKLQHIRQ